MYFHTVLHNLLKTSIVASKDKWGKPFEPGRYILWNMYPNLRMQRLWGLCIIIALRSLMNNSSLTIHSANMIFFSSFENLFQHIVFMFTGVQSARDNSCPRICPQGSSEVPVCGTDGVIYANACELKKKTCGKGMFPNFYSPVRVCSIHCHC